MAMNGKREAVLILVAAFVASSLLFASQGSFALTGNVIDWASAGSFTSQWRITERSDDRQCGGGISTTTYNLRIEHEGGTAKIIAPGFELDGEFDDHVITLSGQFADEGGVTSVQDSPIRLSPDCTGITGTVQWTWAYRGRTCPGSSTIVGERTDGGKCPEVLCVESWECSEWSACVNGEQTRSCFDSNSCGTEQDKPEEFRSCIETPAPAPAKKGLSRVTIGVIGALVVVAGVVWYLLKKKKPSKKSKKKGR